MRKRGSFAVSTTPSGRLLRSDFARDGAIVFGLAMFGNALNYTIHAVLSRKISMQEYGAPASPIAAR